MPPPMMKKELQSFQGMLNYPSKLSPVTAEVYKPLHKLTSIKTEFVLNRMYQDIHQKAQIITKRDACMKFYDVARPLYLEIDTLGIGLGARLLQARDGMNCGHDKIPDNALL